MVNNDGFLAKCCYMHVVPGERRDVFFLFSLKFTYTAKNAQVATRLLKSRNNLLQTGPCQDAFAWLATVC